MKRFFYALNIIGILLPMFLQAQTYLNVHYTDGSQQYKALGSVNKITFSPSGQQINYLLADAGLITQNLALIQKFTFDNSGFGTPLPVDLVSFIAQVNGNSVNLSWKTATEMNSAAFEIEKKQTGTSNWQKAGEVKAAGTSVSPKNYSFSDKGLKAGKLDYRLKMIDNNGTYKYSSVETVEVTAPENFELSQNYPNPFNPTTNISYKIPITGFVSLKVYNIIGKEIATLVNQEEPAGDYKVQFDTHNIASGTYFYKLNMGGVSLFKKMIVIK
jgi:hypothetical protein